VRSIFDDPLPQARTEQAPNIPSVVIVINITVWRAKNLWLGLYRRTAPSWQRSCDPRCAIHLERRQLFITEFEVEIKSSGAHSVSQH